MNNNSINKLEFNKILQALSECAICDKVKEQVLSLEPFLDEKQCKQKIDETTEAKITIENLGTPPLSTMIDIDNILSLSETGGMIIPSQFATITSFISSCKRMKSYLQKAYNLGISFGCYKDSFLEFNTLYEEIERSIRNNNVDDYASSNLHNIRRKIETTNTAIKTKLDSILRSKKEWFSDSYVVTRNGRLVLPVKKEYKHQVNGSIIDISNGGGTCFIEPSAIKKLQDELSILQIDEDNEIRIILYKLTSLVCDYSNELRINISCMEMLDFAFAKAKLSLNMNAFPAKITTKRNVKIINGRHPLLATDKCIPLNFQIEHPNLGVVITGPNTGGKTVVLKTVGLLSLMIQTGLHVPVEKGSCFSMCNLILCDIGDGQNISENLSTFSAHIKNIIHILDNTTAESLVLLDELGSGTDPLEGMGIAIAVLNELKERKCIFICTTHYPEIKEFAQNTDGMINARMAFDRESLQPLYQLQIGKAGESCALYIAKRLGFPSHLLNMAQKEVCKRSSVKNIYNTDIFAKEEKKQNKSSHPTIKKDISLKSTTQRSEKFNVGDSVTVYPQKEVGIVFKCTNELGELGVQVKGKKLFVNHKRLKLICPANELYPENYDFSIIFDTVANRKAHHNMDRKHDPNSKTEYANDKEYDFSTLA